MLRAARFTFLTDCTPSPELERMITLALEGKNPIQNACPDVDYYIDVRLSWQSERVRIFCHLSDMRRHFVRAAVRRVFPLIDGIPQIARQTADHCWESVLNVNWSDILQHERSDSLDP